MNTSLNKLTEQIGLYMKRLTAKLN